MSSTSADPATEIRAVLFDFGGVITSSPFEAFARFEAANGLPDGFIRRVNSTNPDSNAWAKLERSEVSLEEFDATFSAEAAALGHSVRGSDVLALLQGEVRPEMVAEVRRCAERFKVACLTNNFVSSSADGAGGHDVAEVMELFDVIVESSVVGVRKPDPRFYEIACEQLGVQPGEAVFLDDLGINLKPAREMGMATIKVESAEKGIAELRAIIG